MIGFSVWVLAVGVAAAGTSGFSIVSAQGPVQIDQGPAIQIAGGDGNALSDGAKLTLGPHTRLLLRDDAGTLQSIGAGELEVA